MWFNISTICRSNGYPKTIRVDQGSEFISRDMDLWAYAKGVTLDFSRPGKPTDNAFIEAFNGRFRAECLNAQWFLTLDDARSKMEDWRKYYNEVRPHGAMGISPRLRCRITKGSQRAIVKEPENSNIRRSKEWEQRNGGGFRPTGWVASVVSATLPCMSHCSKPPMSC